MDAPVAAGIKALAAVGAGPVLLWIGSCPVFKAPAVVSGFEDMTVVRQTVEQCGCHLCIAEHIGPFTEAQVGGDDDTGLLIDLAEQISLELLLRSIVAFDVRQPLDAMTLNRRSAPAKQRCNEEHVRCGIVGCRP